VTFDAAFRPKVLRVARCREAPARAGAQRRSHRVAQGSTRKGKPVPGKIILLNGASSAGKSTLARGLRAALDEPFWHFSIDHLLAADVLPQCRIDSGEFPWRDLRPRFFDGFHRCLPALAAAGNNLIVEHIVESQEWMRRLRDLLAGHDVFYVGVHCPLPELARRERERGDRRIGDAHADFETTHGFGLYDFEVLTTLPLTGNVDAVIAAWKARRHPSAFEQTSARAYGA
jgi:chloramphenicol 3-O phosphotransferase